MNTAGLVIHPHALELLEQLLVAPPHAVLLTGNAGLGKTLIARQLAHELLKVETLDNQPYYREITGDKNTITIDQIRELIGFFHLQVPGEAAIKRVIVLADADQMGPEAQNALLKLLEEPPTGSVLLLTSSRPSRLLPTIHSRVQIITLPNPEEMALMEHFQSAGHSAAAIRTALLRSGGNIAEIERLLQGGSTDGADPVAVAKQVLSGTVYERLLLVDGLAKQKEVARAFVSTLAQVAQASIGTAAAKSNSRLDRWQHVLAAAYTAEDALEQNGNAKLVLTELMLAL